MAYRDLQLVSANGTSDVSLVDSALDCKADIAGSIMDYPLGLPLLGPWTVWTTDTSSLSHVKEIDQLSTSPRSITSKSVQLFSV